MDLIITADDFGLNPKTNRNITELFLRKKIHRASLLVNFPSSKKALKLAKKYQIPIGLHFNLIEGRPLSPPFEIKTLTNSRGLFYPSYIFLPKLISGKIKTSEIEKELLAQLNFLKINGVPATFINSHQNIHLFPPIYQIIKKHTPALPLRSFQSVTNRFQKFPLKLALIKIISKFVPLYPGNDEAKEIFVHPGTNYDLNFLEKLLWPATNKK